MYAETLDYKYVIDGNETKFKLVPVKVRIQYLNTDVDYRFDSVCESIMCVIKEKRKYIAKV